MSRQDGEPSGAMALATVLRKAHKSFPIPFGELALMRSLAGAAKGRHRRYAAGAAVAAAGLAFSGCAQTPVRTAAYHGHEHFSSAVYGAASARVVEDGQPVPRGGGQYLVGHPYTIAGHTYYPRENENYAAVGMASWYGSAFHGRRTANGEVYDMRSLSAASPTMPLPSYARVTNLANGYSVIVRVNDRGPYHGGRVMDVSSRVADVLNFKGAGTAKIKVEYVGRAPLEGSDDDQLLASLRTDGGPASLDGSGVMVAQQSASPMSPLLHLISAPPAPASEPAVAQAESEPVPRVAAIQASVQAPLRAPLPPSRPFDLGAGARLSDASPPRPPVRLSANDRALYFDVATRANDPIGRLLKAPTRRAAGSGDDE